MKSLVNILYEDNTLSITKNYGREFGEIYIKELIKKGILAELFTQIEAKFPDLKNQLQKTFTLSNNLLQYIKPKKGEEAYKLSSLGSGEAQYLLEELKELIKYVQTSLERIDDIANFDDEKEINKIIKNIDDYLEDMLSIFTSNVSGDEPLQPYKQSKIGFKENTMKITHKRLKQSIRESLKMMSLNEEGIFCNCRCKKSDGSIIIVNGGTRDKNNVCNCQDLVAQFAAYVQTGQPGSDQYAGISCSGADMVSPGGDTRDVRNVGMSSSENPDLFPLMNRWKNR